LAFVELSETRGIEARIKNIEGF